MIVPYGSPYDRDAFKCAFDAGEDGLGNGVNSLKLGCDCLGQIHYWDAHFLNKDGTIHSVENAICMHEEDYGVLWKHTNWRNLETHSRRSRRLVISFIATISNYDYGFYWHLYEDGRIELQVKLTGIISASLQTSSNAKYGTVVAPSVVGITHQHFFGARLDMTVDGVENTVVEVNTVRESATRLVNPHGNAFYQTETVLNRESETRDCNPNSARFWKVIHATKTNRMGNDVSFALIPHGNCKPFATRDNAVMMKRAGFVNHHLWVTPFHPKERYHTGEYPMQRSYEDGVAKWVKQDRSIKDTDLVVWYTFGVTHAVRAEDFPIMPVEHTGFDLKPVNFFDRNPTLDNHPFCPDRASKMNVKSAL